jgi:hypothetical protein
MVLLLVLEQQIKVMLASAAILHRVQVQEAAVRVDYRLKLQLQQVGQVGQVYLFQLLVHLSLTQAVAAVEVTAQIQAVLQQQAAVRVVWETPEAVEQLAPQTQVAAVVDQVLTILLAQEPVVMAVQA